MNNKKRRMMKQDTSSKPNGLPGAQTIRVLELVNYQDGAVVSREFVRKPPVNKTNKQKEGLRT